MTDTHGGHSAAAAEAPFSNEEVQAFQASDIHAAAVIVVLMASIFATGMVLYAVVAYAAWAY
jgi:hypothetical protein